LLGWATREPATLVDLLGADDLDAFTDLSSRHGDGWGTAAVTAHGEPGVAVQKSATAARDDETFRRWARTAATDLGLAHLRMATLGLGVHHGNTHPFTDGRVAFAHNGSIHPPAALDALLPEDLEGMRRGDTDSERYFLAVLDRLRVAAPGEALASAVEAVAATARYSSLNCLLLTPDELYAVCRYDPVAEVTEHEEGYFRLGYRVTADGVVVASSGWGEGWREIGNGEVLVVRRATLDVAVHPLADLAAVG
jgi:predicted glutamine amidotransferase